MKKLCALALILSLLAAPVAGLADVPYRQVTPLDRIRFQRPDGDAICRQLESLAAKARGETNLDVLSRYMETAGALLDTVDTMRALLQVTRSALRERLTLEDTYVNVSDAYQDFVWALMETDHAQALWEKYPRWLDGYIWDLLPPDAQTQRLLDHEAELVTQAEDILYEATVRQGGSRLTLDEIGWIEDEGEWAQASQAWYDAHYGDLIEIFVELVKTRTVIAQMRGYDTYPHMLFDQYGLGYTPRQAQALAEDIIRHIVPVQDRLYYEEGGYWEADFTISLADFLDQARPLLADLNPDFGQVFDILVDNGLYYIDPSKDTDYGITHYLPDYDQPAIAQTFYEDFYSVDTFIHEFGHFYENYLAGAETVTNLDVAEVHSQGMEMLFYGRIGELAGEDGYMLEYDLLAGMLDTLVDYSYNSAIELAVYGLDYQDMTAETVHAIAGEVYDAYGYLFGDYAFENNHWIAEGIFYWEPFGGMYYCLSAILALDIWEAAQADEARAVRMYHDLIDARAGNILAAAEALGVESPFAPGRMARLATLLNEDFLDAGMAYYDQTPGEEDWDAFFDAWFGAGEKEEKAEEPSGGRPVERDWGSYFDQWFEGAGSGVQGWIDSVR